MKFRDQWADARITAIDDASPTIRMFEIDPGAHYQGWSAGSHLRLKVQVEGREEIRTYSLIELGRGDRRYRIAVKLIEQGMGGSRAMWTLAAGDTLTISQPHNHFDLSRYASSCTLLAGGVGITPLVSMAYALRHDPRPVRMVYGVRNRAEAAFAGELRDWLGERLQLCVHDEDGPLDLAAVIGAIEPDGELYLCGPIGMLEAARRLWIAAGRPIGLLRYETFAASGHYPNQAFTAVLPRFEREIEVLPHQSLLAALEQAGVEVMADCRRGECGLCALDVLACERPLDHRDVFFSDAQKAAGDKLCACVSRPAGGRITLDTSLR